MELTSDRFNNISSILTCKICEGFLRTAHTIIDCGHSCTDFYLSNSLFTVPYWMFNQDAAQKMSSLSVANRKRV